MTFASSEASFQDFNSEFPITQDRLHAICPSCFPKPELTTKR